jgi:hypothetical protein
MEHLKAFSPSEIDVLICGERSGLWNLTLLMENIKCDHGYSSSSRAVEFLLEIMSEFDSEQQRKFLLFITGSPKLPVGGRYFFSNIFFFSFLFFCFALKILCFLIESILSFSFLEN